MGSRLWNVLGPTCLCVVVRGAGLRGRRVWGYFGKMPSRRTKLKGVDGLNSRRGVLPSNHVSAQPKPVQIFHDDQRAAAHCESTDRLNSVDPACSCSSGACLSPHGQISREMTREKLWAELGLVARTFHKGSIRPMVDFYLQTFTHCRAVLDISLQAQAHRKSGLSWRHKTAILMPHPLPTTITLSNSR